MAMSLESKLAWVLDENVGQEEFGVVVRSAIRSLGELKVEACDEEEWNHASAVEVAVPALGAAKTNKRCQLARPKLPTLVDIAQTKILWLLKLRPWRLETATTADFFVEKLIPCIGFGARH